MGKNEYKYDACNVRQYFDFYTLNLESMYNGITGLQVIMDVASNMT